MKVQVLIHLLLIGVAFCAPSTKISKKYPKKFDKDIHSISEKKGHKVLPKSSYSSYKQALANMPLLPPPPPSNVDYQDQWWNLVRSGKPIFVHREDVSRPQAELSPPDEDTYAGTYTSRDYVGPMSPPAADPVVEEEPQSYVVYVGERLIPLKVPEPWTYAEVPQGGDTIPSGVPTDLQPPSFLPPLEGSPLISSYSSISKTKEA